LDRSKVGSISLDIAVNDSAGVTLTAESKIVRIEQLNFKAAGSLNKQSAHRLCESALAIQKLQNASIAAVKDSWTLSQQSALYQAVSEIAKTSEDLGPPEILPSWKFVSTSIQRLRSAYAEHFKRSAADQAIETDSFLHGLFDFYKTSETTTVNNWMRTYCLEPRRGEQISFPTPFSGSNWGSQSHERSSKGNCAKQ
jgi:hypothetical protein